MEMGIMLRLGWKGSCDHGHPFPLSLWKEVRGWGPCLLGKGSGSHHCHMNLTSPDDAGCPSCATAFLEKTAWTSHPLLVQCPFPDNSSTPSNLEAVNYNTHHPLLGKGHWTSRGLGSLIFNSLQMGRGAGLVWEGTLGW